METKKTFRLSPSVIKLMLECPKCFWLTYHKVWKRPVSVFPSLPSGMDRILKIHFDKFMERGELPPELCKNKECREMKLFNDKEKLKIWQSNFKGVFWKDREGNELHGAVDNILVKYDKSKHTQNKRNSSVNVNNKNKGGEKLIVLDYKTRGYPLKKDTHEHYQAQMDIYNFLLRQNGYDTEDYSYLLFYYPKEVLETGEVIFDTTLVKMKVDVKKAEKIWKDALECLNGECPEKSCEWCERV